LYRYTALGAGCAGLPGIALALRHKMKVVLTEMGDVIPLLRANVAAIQAQVGRYKSNAVDPQLESAWFRPFAPMK
jgi:hypothetical protein